MGGDGGSLNNSRREHTRLRTAVLSSTHSRASRNAVSRHDTVHDALNLCAITKRQLNLDHAVGDRLGHLMNKDALIEHLLARRRARREKNEVGTLGEAGNEGDKWEEFGHIRGLRDVIKVHLLPKRDGQGWVCPVGGREAGTGGGVWVMGWPCGCCGEKKAGEHVRGEQKGICLFCGKEVEQMVRLGMGEEEKLKKRESLEGIRKKKRKRDGKTMAREAKKLKTVDETGGDEVYRSLFLGKDAPKNETFTGVA